MARHRYSYYEVVEYRKKNNQRTYYFNLKDTNVSVSNGVGRDVLNLGHPFALIVLIVIIIGLMLYK